MTTSYITDGNRLALNPGVHIGPYEILAALGAGGMGEVYRARDTKLNREVALKILPAAFTADPDRLARFKREAQVLASLNHLHIGAIYGFEDSGETHALVLELVEGDTLADRIARGLIPLDEALPIARQICEALEAAHEQGVIHRDLKPANIKITPDGVVKVLDFGLAKLAHPEVAASHADLTASPTITSPAMMTGVGVLLGTAAYMSPEQAKGREADKRSDMWAFGCVFYEMLTGRRAFDGDDMTEVLGAVVRLDPNWEAFPSDVPLPVRTLLHRCLVKDRRKRIAGIAAALFVLDHQAGVVAISTVSARPQPRKLLWRRIAALTAGALVVAIAATALTWFATRPVPPRVSRLTIATSGPAALHIDPTQRHLAITPDGTRVVYVGNRGTQLFVRALNAMEPVPVFTGAALLGTFVSPDGEWIGFSDAGGSRPSLKKVAITGGSAVPLATLDGALRGATWGTDDAIIVATANPQTGLQQIAPGAGSATVVTRPNRAQGEADHLWPELLPGGRALLFTITAITGGLDAAQVVVLDLLTGTRTVVVRGGSHAHYVASGHLVYAAAGTLRAVPFDLANLGTLGTAVTVVPNLLTTLTGGVYGVVSGDGTLVHLSGTVLSEVRTLVWVDRGGHEEPVNVPARAYAYPRLSPDGTRVAVEIRDQDWDIWIVNLVSSALQRFSLTPGPDRLPVWTPNGSRIVWTSGAGGSATLYWQAADRSGSLEQLIKSPNPQYPSAFSRDGTRLVIREDAESRDLMVVAMDEEPRRVQPLIQTPFVETSAEISYDGRFIAYASDESGQDEIYVRPFPEVNAWHRPVSIGGGAKPRWARNGRELFYLVQNGGRTAVMSTPIERSATFAAGTPKKVLEGPYFFGSTGTGNTAFRTYDVSLDDQRFLMIKNPEGAEQAATSTNITVIQNWTEELKRLVPTK